MWLASKFLLSVIAQQRHIIEQRAGRTVYQGAFRVDDEEMVSIMKDLQEDPYYHIVMRASALFHDIGHGPFSHLFDYFFPNAAEMLGYCSEDSFSHIHPLLQKMHGSKPDESVKHEFFSCLIATQVLRERADELAQYGIDADGMVFDVCAIIDANLKPSPNLCKGAYSIHTLLHDIISGDVDVDRMDYLLRDSHMSGVNYGLYDPNRIHKSMCAYASIKTKSLRLGVRYSGLGAVEDFLIRRHQMFAQIYGHKTNRACYAMLEAIRKRLIEARWRWYDGCGTMADLLAIFSRLDDASFVSQLLGNPKLAIVKDLAEALFVHRKLLKRVFEERIASSDEVGVQPTREKWERYKASLDLQGCPYEPDDFKMRRPDFHDSGFSLKVLRKTPGGTAYEVFDFHVLSTIVQYLPAREIIYRVFVDEAYVVDAKRLVLTASSHQ
jgi:HD superfamily phosphohydrolase